MSAPPLGLAPPPLGNPGSATGYDHSKKIKVHSDVATSTATKTEYPLSVPFRDDLIVIDIPLNTLLSRSRCPTV